ncbi:hypothetical protein GGD83_004819 [Rhodoblastus sphagnicola]|uniref:hypothetical protein n=1 Tax=Rhodoblastus sphagnicola TaxID=333368 RepID=UPI001305019A|nr:hypothetical protein [Rhodoblastus sphagnicola]MBB4200989.1 hypothetical protein [Rhodoblastus sphagnicola]
MASGIGFVEPRLFAFDRYPIGADENLHALWLLSVLVKLIGKHARDNDEAADDKKNYVGAIHGFDLG